MSGGLDGLRERLAAFLQEKGLRAMTDWPAEPREQLDGPVAVVSLRGCQAGPAGFQHYLGERYDKEREQWVEVYGQKVQFTFGLDLYAPPKLGEGPYRPPWTSWRGACAGAGPEGLDIRGVFLRRDRVRPGQPSAETAGPGGMHRLPVRRDRAWRRILDFEVRGESHQ